MKPARILLVEDDEIFIRTVERMLLSEGHHLVGSALNAEDAIKAARELDPDIVLMDINLDEQGDGVQAATEIQKFSIAPIIYLTSHTEHEIVERARQTAPYGYVLKPFTKKELSITIKMALAKHELERRVQESEARLAAILASIPSAVLHLDLAGKIIYCNRNTLKFLNAEEDDIIGQQVDDVVQLRLLPDETAVGNIFSQLSGDGIDGVLNDESNLYFLVSRNSAPSDGAGDGAADATPAATGQIEQPLDSENRIVKFDISPIMDHTGINLGYVAILVDVTSHQMAERRIRTLASALENLEDAVVITSAEWEDQGPRILYVNDGLERITGWTREECLGNPVTMLKLHQDHTAFLRELQKIVGAQRRFNGDYISQTSDGRELYTHWSVSPVPNPDGKTERLVFVIRDLTHVHRLEESIRQSQKIEAVGRLAGGIAHDFNNLLSVINSYSDLLMLKLGEESPMTKYASQIRAAGKKGATLVSQLMTFSRRDKPQPMPLDLGEVTEEIKIMLRRVIRENIELETRYAEELKPVWADQGQIEQTLINMCVNARDAMPHGGKISIDIQNRFVNRTDKIAAYIRPGPYIMLAVADTGCGMDEETRKHIFEPFFTTKKIGEGTGLGLSTVYGIIKSLGGYIEVESTLGEGTCFCIYLPVATRKPEVEVASPDDDESAFGGEAPQATRQCRVLVVEDDETFLDCITGLLALHGYIVQGATTGAEAMNLIESGATDIDLLITDIILPNYSGRELGARLEDGNPNVKIIYMTGYDDQLDSFTEYQGDSLILQKPFPLNALLNKVKELFDADTMEVDSNT